ncbi:MAG: cyclic nucleotide-binding domain-containing protein [Actinomycetota bacterium]
MRIQSSVTSLSWIPSEAIQGLKSLRLPFDIGIAHYDEVPPEVLENIEDLRAHDRFRFVNNLKAWIEVRNGKITAWGHSGKGHIGATTLRFGPAGVTVPAVPFPDLRPDPLVGPDRVQFVQTAGGRTGVPAPRRVRRKPYIQITSPVAWTTLELTIHADGSSAYRVRGASSFPRHWIYDPSGKLVAKSGLIDFKGWAQEAFGQRTPWGAQDSPAIVTQVETHLERTISKTIMTGRSRPKMRMLHKGEALAHQGDPGNELYLLLDGVLRIEVDGNRVSEVGPGAILGERAILEAGKRTASLIAVTDCRVAVAPGDKIDRAVLADLSKSHQREYRPGAK